MDKIKPLKIETLADGSQDDNGYQTEANPNEDYVACKGIAFENLDGVTIDRDATTGEIRLNDPVNGSVLLSELLEKNLSIFHWTSLNCGEIQTDKVLTYYDATGGLSINSGAVVGFNTTVANSDLFVFSVSSGVITCNEAGTFFVNYDVTIDSVSGGRSVAEIYIEVDTGSGFSEYTGSKSFTYNRNANAGENTASMLMLINLSAGDKIRVYANRIEGNAGLVTKANASRISLFSKNNITNDINFGLDCGNIGDVSNVTNGQIDCGGL
jgi:hypothetical protein